MKKVAYFHKYKTVMKLTDLQEVCAVDKSSNRLYFKDYVLIDDRYEQLVEVNLQDVDDSPLPRGTKTKITS